MIQAVPPPHHQEHKTVHTASGIVEPLPTNKTQRFLDLFIFIMDEMELHSISFTIAAGSSVDLTIVE
jgi:hypothetical protein